MSCAVQAPKNHIYIETGVKAKEGAGAEEREREREMRGGEGAVGKSCAGLQKQETDKVLAGESNISDFPGATRSSVRNPGCAVSQPRPSFFAEG